MQQRQTFPTNGQNELITISVVAIYNILAWLCFICYADLSPYVHLSFGRWCTDRSLLDTLSSEALWELVKLLGWLNKLSVKMLRVFHH